MIVRRKSGRGTGAPYQPNLTELDSHVSGFSFAVPTPLYVLNLNAVAVVALVAPAEGWSIAIVALSGPRSLEPRSSGLSRARPRL
jgi:hypothetical protein